MRKLYTGIFIPLFVSAMVAAQAPVIDSFSPAYAAVGATVVISGNHFSSIPDSNTVFFGPVKAVVTASSVNSITCLVPAGSAFEPIAVTVSSLTAYSSQNFVTSFRTGISLRTNSFGEPVTIAAAQLPCLGDLDGDGLMDMAAIINNNKIAVFKNIADTTGNPAFINGIEYATTTTPVQIITADFDGDGKSDLAVAGTGSTVISIYRNLSSNGNVLFSSQSFYSLGTELNPYSIDANDIDGDGKIDIVVGHAHSGTCFSVARNTGSTGIIAFANSIRFAFGTVPGGSGNVGDANKISVTDIDGDGKPDVTSLSRFFPPYLIYRNTSTPGTVSFAPKVAITSNRNIAVGNGYFDVKLADIDGDGKKDILYVSSDSSLLSIYRNTSVAGNISFTAKMNIDGPYTPFYVAVNDLNGDGKPDIAVVASNYLSVFQNSSQPGNVSINPKIDYTAGSVSQAAAIIDIDHDGKADLLMSGTDVNNNDRNTTVLLKNIVGQTAPLLLCPVTDSISLLADKTGSSYQWQLNTGNGFVDISDDSNYTGNASIMLQLKNIPSGWYGYQYRCVVDGSEGSIQFLKFTATWTGNFNSLWDNPANWACGQLPDANTDVVINAGGVKIGSDVTVRSIKVQPGCYITVDYGFHLTVLH